jgi:threonine dehydratase
MRRMSLRGTVAAMSMTLESLAATRRLVAEYVPPTPAYAWPLLARATGADVWVKHENHTPTGAFKVRGGLNFLSRLIAEHGRPAGLVSASRGNHSQSLAYAGRAFGVPVTIVVPEGNSPDKNAATEAFGAEVIVYGEDFQAAREYSVQLGEERGLVAVPPFHPWLMEGVATYAAELHEQVPGLEAVYVPVGMGSGVSANIAVRDLLGLDCEIVGVVAENAPAYALSYEAGHVVTTESADTFVDGVACRVPDPDAVERVIAGCARIVRISEADAAKAMVLMYRATHNLAEPAGSLALAAVLAEGERVAGRKVAMILTGGNCDLDVLEAAARR